MQVVYYSIALQGVSLYLIYNIAFPFHNDDENELINDILTANVTFPKYLSKSLIDLMEEIFVVSPKKRYTIEQIKQHPWFMMYIIYTNPIAISSQL